MQPLLIQTECKELNLIDSKTKKEFMKNINKAVNNEIKLNLILIFTF